MTVKEIVAKAIGAAMTRRRLSPEDIELLCGIGRKHVRQYVSGKETPTIEELEVLADVLGVRSPVDAVFQAFMHNRGPWSEREDALVRKGFEVARLAKMLPNRTSGAIGARRIALGVARKNRKKGDKK